MAKKGLGLEKHYRKARILLDLWIHPMKIKCPAPGHNGVDTQSCSCRQIALERRTKALLEEVL